MTFPLRLATLVEPTDWDALYQPDPRITERRRRMALRKCENHHWLSQCINAATEDAARAFASRALSEGTKASDVVWALTFWADPQTRGGSVPSGSAPTPLPPPPEPPRVSTRRVPAKDTNGVPATLGGRGMTRIGTTLSGWCMTGHHRACISILCHCACHEKAAQS